MEGKIELFGKVGITGAWGRIRVRIGKRERVSMVVVIEEVVIEWGGFYG